MEETKPIISIIVPVYNAGNKLYKCLDTLVDQTFKQLEIILIIDCPTDSSDIISRKYAKKDNRIILIENTQNLHIGESRNKGIQIAKGEYIGFSDHDDFRDLQMYEKLYNFARMNNSDIVLSDYIALGDNNIHIKLPKDYIGLNLKDVLLNELIRGGNDQTNTPYALTIQTNIYKSDLLKDNNIFFVDTLKCTPEDRIFQIMCFFYAKQINCLPEPLYYHYTYNSSAGKTYLYKSIHNRAKGKLEIYEFLIRNNCYNKYKYLFLTSVKKEFTELLISELNQHYSILTFCKNVYFLKKYSFCKEAYRTTRYLYPKFYSIGGKVLRNVISFIMCI